MSMRDSRPTNDSGDRFGREYKKKRADFVTSVGDFFEGTVNLLINPNSIYMVAFFLGGFVLLLNSVPYINLFEGTFNQLVGTVTFLPLAVLIRSWMGLVATVVGICILLVIQVFEVVPRLPKYLPSWGERLLFKLNRIRYERPYAGDNGPTLTGKAYGWVRNAHDRSHQRATIISLLFYLFDTWVCSCTYPLWMTTGEWSIWDVFICTFLVFGFEFFLLMGSIIAAQRLNASEAAEFIEKKRNLRG